MTELLRQAIAQIEKLSGSIFDKTGGVTEVWLSNWNPLLERVCWIANNTSRTPPESASMIKAHLGRCLLGKDGLRLLFYETRLLYHLLIERLI